MYAQISISKGSNNTVYEDNLLLQPIRPTGLKDDFPSDVFLSLCTPLLLIAFRRIHRDTYNTYKGLNFWSINILKWESTETSLVPSSATSSCVILTKSPLFLVPLSSWPSRCSRKWVPVTVGSGPVDTHDHSLGSWSLCWVCLAQEQ